MAYRNLKASETAETIFDDFLARLEENINDPKIDRNDLVRNILYEIFYGQRPNSKQIYSHKHPIAARAVIASFDPSNVKTEVANLTAVDNQYANPIYIGAVNNVDTAIALYKSKQKLAGFPKVLAEAKKQAAAFVAKQKK